MVSMNIRLYQTAGIIIITQSKPHAHTLQAIEWAVGEQIENDSLRSFTNIFNMVLNHQLPLPVKITHGTITTKQIKEHHLMLQAWITVRGKSVKARIPLSLPVLEQTTPKPLIIDPMNI